MRALILTFYFPPDLSAGSFRARALVDALSDQLASAGEVRVLTSEPNRYNSYDARDPREQRTENVSVTRFPVPEHRSGMVDQAWSYVAYAYSVLREVWGESGNYDVVYATSSRLMTGVLGAVVARWIGAPFYLDVRDLFPVNLSELFAGKPQKTVVPFLQWLERWTIGTASRVSVVSPGFVDHLQAIRDDLDYRVFTNGIDEEFLEVDFRAQRSRHEGPRIILYGGNIGEGQGLERVVPGAAMRLTSEYEFWIVGDGGRRRRLEQKLTAAGNSNVRLFDPVPREQLLEFYRRADVLFLHLNDYEAFRRVLPSKVFEYAATGKPVLAGVDGVSRDFISQHISNASVFSPCDVSGLIRALGELELEMESRSDFVNRFRRSSITNEMAADIVALATSRATRRRQGDGESAG